MLTIVINGVTFTATPTKRKGYYSTHTHNWSAEFSRNTCRIWETRVGVRHSAQRVVSEFQRALNGQSVDEYLDEVDDYAAHRSPY